MHVQKHFTKTTLGEGGEPHRYKETSKLAVSAAAAELRYSRGGVVVHGAGPAVRQGPIPVIGRRAVVRPRQERVILVHLKIAFPAGRESIPYESWVMSVDSVVPSSSFNTKIWRFFVGRSSCLVALPVQSKGSL